MRRADLEDRVVERTPLAGHVGKSGASLDRWVLDDGRTFVVKTITPESDLLMSLTGDSSGREYSLWASGLLDHLPAHMAHAIVGGWSDRDAAVLVMRDLDGRVLSWEDRLDGDRCRWVLRRLAELHRAYSGLTLDRWEQALTPLPEFVTLFSPDRVRPHLHGANALPALVVRGWELFEAMVEPDVAGPVLGLLHHPGPLVAALRRRPRTLVHGDFAVVNMAVESDVLVMLDWSMPAAAPGALDLTRFVAGCSSVTDLSREQIIEEYAEAAGASYDEPAMRLSLLASAAWLCWNKALDAAEHPDPAIRDREREDLDWWVSQARATIRSGLL